MKLLRVYFSKRDEAAYISHLDLQRVMARALRRSGLPVWYSQGFNPHIYMSFSLPLPLMQHSICETVDCKTETEQTDFSEYLGPLNEALPRGLVASRIGEPLFPASAIEKAQYSFRYAAGDSEVQKAVAAYNALAAAPVVRKTKRTQEEIDLKRVLPRLEEENGFTALLPAGSTLNYNPALLAGVFEERCGLPAAGVYILREAVYTSDGELFE